MQWGGLGQENREGKASSLPSVAKNKGRCVCEMLGGGGRGVQVEQEGTLMASSQALMIQPLCSPPLPPSPASLLLSRAPHYSSNT